MVDVLVCSDLNDVHADAVLWGLEALGRTAVLWRLSDFPATQALTIHASPAAEERCCIQIENASVDLETVGAVWNRRPGQPQLANDLDPQDREFAGEQSRRHLDSFLDVASSKSRWVNPPEVWRRDVDKAHQLRSAKMVGFTVPDTLFSNSPDEVLSFFDLHHGQVVYKTYQPNAWVEGDGARSIFYNYTTTLTRADVLNRAALSFCPGIFQRRISGAYEARVTIIGEQLFCVRIDASSDDSLDWRKQGRGVRLKPLRAPVEVEQKCMAFMDEAGMVFACLDFIVSTQGDWCFIEANQAGQFLWKEEILPDMPLLGAMCEFLLQGKAHAPVAGKLRFQDYLASERHERLLSRVKRTPGLKRA